MAKEEAPRPVEFTVEAAGRAPKKMLLDPAAETADPQHPPFVAKPPGAPVYYGFPLLEETLTDGWILGAITDYLDANGCTDGDAFVQAPDGSRAGLVWEVGMFETYQICSPTPDRWGVYAIAFPHAVRTTEDIVHCFHAVLPELKLLHAQATGDRR